MAQQSRERVLDSALRLFGQRGFGGTSLQAIADDVGMTKASVYHHFRAKADLLEVLAQPFLDRLETLLARPADSSGPARCRILLEGYLDALVEARVLATLLIGDPTASGHPASARYRLQRSRLRHLLARCGSRPADAVQVACCLGAIHSAVIDFSDIQPAENRTAVVDAAMAALGLSPPQRVRTRTRS
ncbi:MAG: TetR/AcrR family transcriptional regulator [Acidimicrobiales bacterium]